MTPIHLTGLSADLPIAVMAAFGTLRVAQRVEQLRGAKLSWEPRGSSFTAVLWTPVPCSAEELSAALLADVRATLNRPELSWSDTIKGATRTQFVEAIEKHGACDGWFAAFGSDLALRNEKIVPTPFDTTGGPQRFLAIFGNLIRSLSTETDSRSLASFHEAIIGPWRYLENQHALGWDPNTIRLGAFTHMDPSPMPKAAVRTAIMLAFESLPCFPCFYSGGLATRAFRKIGRTVYLRWPVWEAPVSILELETLLAWNELTAENPKLDRLKARGIWAIFQSQRYKLGDYYSAFRSADLVAGGVPLAHAV